MTTEAAPGGCFFEDDPGLGLGRRALAEAVGALLLAFVVFGSGLAAQQTAETPPLLGLIGRGFAASATLCALIIALGPVSGGHFNPLITAAQWLRGERGLPCLIAYAAAQLLGAVAGAVLASAVMGGEGKILVWRTWPLFANELIASTGLMIIVLTSARVAEALAGPIAAGGWILMTWLALPVAAFANPVLAIASWAITPFAPAGPVQLLLHLAPEIVGATAAIAVVSVLHPQTRAARSSRR